MDNGKEILFFYKHIVPILFEFSKGNDTVHYQISTFVISKRDKWFLITAAHTVEKIDDYLASGYELKRSGLLDSLNYEATDSHLISFTFKSFKKLMLNNDGMDYCAIYLTPLYKELLEKNKIVPLDERTWKQVPDNADLYWLIGIPEQLIKSTVNGLEYHPALIKVEKFDGVPEGFKAIEFPCFYGVDFSTYQELISAMKNSEAVKELIGADSLSFLSIDALTNAVGKNGLCQACFNGNYPTHLYDKLENANIEIK